MGAIPYTFEALLKMDRSTTNGLFCSHSVSIKIVIGTIIYLFEGLWVKKFQYGVNPALLVSSSKAKTIAFQFHQGGYFYPKLNRHPFSITDRVDGRHIADSAAVSLSRRQMLSCCLRVDFPTLSTALTTLCVTWTNRHSYSTEQMTISLI